MNSVNIGTAKKVILVSIAVFFVFLMLGEQINRGIFKLKLGLSAFYPIRKSVIRDIVNYDGELNDAEKYRILIEWGIRDKKGFDDLFKMLKNKELGYGFYHVVAPFI